jgi:hypothetical protein
VRGNVHAWFGGGRQKSVPCGKLWMMERHILQADEARRYWRYRIAHGGQTFIQTVYAGGDGHLYSYVLRCSPEEHGGRQGQMLHPLLKPGDREFATIDDAIAVGDSLIRQSALNDAPDPSQG